MPEIGWRIVRDEKSLVYWQKIWNRGVEPERSIFLPSLLQEGNIAIIAAFDSQRIIAGAIANKTEGLVGISNVFTPEDAAAEFWKGCLRKIMDHFPGMPVVGYEREVELSTALSAGFASIGPLRVWVKGAN